jgi:hypothetical protein
MTFFINFCVNRVKEGHLKPEAVTEWTNIIAHGVTSSLVLSNIVLMYMSKDEDLALASSVVSLFTETAAKLYSVWLAQKEADGYLDAAKSKVKGKLSKLGSPIQVGSWRGEKKKNKKTRKQKEDIATMQAVRWSGEIVAEKSCLMVGSMIAMVFLNVERSFYAHSMLTIFSLAIEVITDSFVVYILEKKCGVPFLRLPPPMGITTREFWIMVVRKSLFISAALFFNLLATGTVERWFQMDAKVAANQELNVTMAMNTALGMLNATTGMQ